jgi:endoglucanase
MNEPHDIPSLQTWAGSVQAAVNAIRAAGATSQVILIPGSSYSSAATLPTEAGPYLLKVTDPAGGVGKLVFDVHKVRFGGPIHLSPRSQSSSTSTRTTLARTPTV